MPPRAEVRRLVMDRSTGIAVLLGLTMLRLLTDGGLGGSAATQVYLFAVAAVAVSWCVPLVRRSVSPERPPPPPPERPNLDERPERLEIFEDMLEHASRSAYVREYRLRPAFRTVVNARLQRAGIDLDTDPRSRQILGETAWSLAQLAQPAGTAQTGRTSQTKRRPTDGIGLTMAEVRELLDVLHRIETGNIVQTGVRH